MNQKANKAIIFNAFQFIQNELLCSSSDDDDDEFQQIFKKRKTWHRTKNFISDVIQNYSEKEFKEKLHVSKETADFLIDMYAKSSTYELRKYKGGRSQIPASKHILSYLWFCSNDDSMREICCIFDLTLSSFSSVIQKVTFFITEEITPTVIKFPNDEISKQVIADEFEKISGFPNVLGCIDRICISIRALRRTTRPMFIHQRDSKISIILQGICDSKNRFLDISTRVPSKMPESRTFNLSLISKDIEEICGSTYHMLGNAAYPIREFLLTPYSEYLSKSEEEYNMRFCETRVKIEIAFGMLKSRFRQLNRLDFQNVETMTNFYLACCSLHNLCIDRNDTWSPTNDESEGTSSPPQENSSCYQDNDDNEQDGLLEELGKAKRDNIRNSFCP